MNAKEKTSQFVAAVGNNDAAVVEKFVDENYVQHNPFHRRRCLLLHPQHKIWCSRKSLFIALYFSIDRFGSISEFCQE